MKKLIIIFTLVMLVMLFGADYARAGTWTTLDYPGAAWTEVWGISGNSIVGVYLGGGSPHEHGFIYNGTSWTTLDYPGAAFTEAYGISGNSIVGYYDDSSGGHGFIYNGTSWTTLDYPGAGVIYTSAYGISGNSIVGVYVDSSGQHGFIYNGTSWTTLDYPGAERTAAYGISGNSIVGVYLGGGSPHEHGFIYNGTSWTTLDYPGAEWIDVWGISGNNIVGYYDDGSVGHSFIYNGTSWTTLDYPGAAWTSAYGISGNSIVGRYGDGCCNYHGFLYTILEPATVLFLDKKNPSFEVKGAAADGATEVIIKILNVPEDATINDIQISLPHGDEDGSLENDKHLADGVFTQTYVSPTCFARNGNYPSYGIRTINLNITVLGEQVEHQPFTLIRPPVVMVHGLWGQLRDFNDLRIKLEQNGWEKDFLCRVSYNNANSFRDPTNIKTLSNNITNTLSIVRSEGYAVRKVDVVAHSMGGLLVKKLDTNFAQENIRKIITIGTPYQGSPFADLLSDALVYDFVRTLILQELIDVFYNTQNSIVGGAIFDLRVQNNSELPISTQIPGVDCSNIIVGLRDDSPLPKFPVAILKLATRKWTLEDAHNVIFGQGVTTDWIVPTDSQKGDAPTWETKPVKWHCSEPQDPNIISLVIDWLNQPAQISQTQNSLIANGNSTVTLREQYSSSEGKMYSNGNAPSESNEPNGTIEITSPSEGQICTAGGNITVSVQGTGDTTQAAVFAFFGTSSWADIVQLPWVGDVNVPSDSVGSTAEIIVIGLDPNMNITDRDEVNLAMNSNIVLQEIFFGFGNTWYFDFKNFPQQSHELHLYPMGVFSDGSEHPLSILAEPTTYETYDGNIATVDANGLITVHSQGTTWIAVTCLAETAYLQIEADANTGDLDLNGYVDFIDYAIFASHWAEQNCAEPDWCEGTDFDHSGSVDMLDLGEFAKYWLSGS